MRVFHDHRRQLVHHPSNLRFTVVHYAGRVEYNVDDWLEKNRDKLDDPVAVVMQDSENRFVSSLFHDLNPDREGAPTKVRGKHKAVRPYISVAHKSQLEKLMKTLRSTQPHFIRCIKVSA